MTMKQKAHTALASVVLASTFLLLAATLLHGTDFEASEAGLDNPQHKVDLDVDANYDNEISKPAPDDPIEESAGGVVCVGKRDEIIIRRVEPESWIVDVILEIKKGAPKINVFRTETEGTPILFNGTDNRFSGSEETKLYVQGEEVSDEPRDVELTLESDPPGGADAISYTVFKVDIKRDGNVITGTTTDVVVGEKINLTGEVSPSGIAISSKQWTIPPSSVKTYLQTVETGTKSDLSPADLQHDTISYHWIDGGDARVVKYSLVVGGTTCEGSSTFNISCPQGTITSELTDLEPAVDLRGDSDWNLWLVFGTASIWGGSHGITYTGKVTTGSNQLGTISLVQVVSIQSTFIDVAGDNWITKNPAPGVFVLDSWEGTPHRDQENIGSSDTKEVDAYDSPGMRIYSQMRKIDHAMSFNVYLMYKHDSANSIWITLSKMPWAWSGSAEGTSDASDWECTDRVSPATAPYGSESTELPEWDSALPGAITYGKVTL